MSRYKRELGINTTKTKADFALNILKNFWGGNWSNDPAVFDITCVFQPGRAE